MFPVIRARFALNSMEKKVHIAQQRRDPLPALSGITGAQTRALAAIAELPRDIRAPLLKRAEDLMEAAAEIEGRNR